MLNRTGLVTFCGSRIEVFGDSSSPDCYQTIKNFENGEYKHTQIKTKHPNIVKSIIIGKKGWGLWIKQWSQGIGEGTFTKYEIFQEFEKRNLEIPEPLMEDFNNNIWRERIKYHNVNS